MKNKVSLVKVWNDFMNIIYGICAYSMFFLMMISIWSIVYYSYMCYNFMQVVSSTVVLGITTYSYSKLKE